HKGWFHIDNVIIDHYASIIGTSALGLYCALARYGNNDTRICYPSYSTLAKKLKMSRKTIKRNIELLQHHKLIRVEARTSNNGDADSNLYVLLQPWGFEGGSFPMTPPLERENADDERREDEVGSPGNQVGSPGNYGGVTRKLRVGS